MSEPIGAKIKILLIEDNYMFRDMYGIKIEQAGFELFCAVSGDDGLKLMREKKPNLVLMDVVMPDGDGFESLEEIRNDPELIAIPVIMLTNLSNDEDRAESLRLGAKDYLIKACLLYTSPSPRD